MSTFYQTNQEGTNKATEEITNIILDAGNSATSIKRKIKKMNKAKHSAGYDTECHTLKKNMNQLSNLLHRFPKDPAIRTSYLLQKRQYKKLVKNKNKEFKQQILNQLETLQSSNPKEYWKLINKLREIDKDGTKKKNEPDFEALIKHYEELNENISNDQEGTESISKKIKLLENNISAKQCLDKSITIEEIKHNIAKLRVGKSCRPDNILN